MKRGEVQGRKNEVEKGGCVKEGGVRREERLRMTKG